MFHKLNETNKTLLYLWCSVFAFAAAHVCVTTVKLFCLLPYAETPRSTPARFTLTAPLAALLLGVVVEHVCIDDAASHPPAL